HLGKEFAVGVSFACLDVHKINSRGLWFGDDPLSYTVPLLLLQLSLLSIFSRAIYILLKPFGQLSIVSQILGGVILGPSVLGHDTSLAAKVFSFKGRNVLETLSVFGFMLFIFQIGVKMDPAMSLRSGKRAMAIGVLGFFVPYVLSGFVAFLLGTFLSLDHDVSTALPLVVTVQSVTAFPVIACFLTELNILNSEIGHLASASSIICDMCHWSIMTMKFTATLATTKSLKTSFGSLFSIAFFVILIVFGIRPAALWATRRTPEGQPVKEIYVFAALIALLVCGLVGEVLGLNAFITCFLVGLVIPDGPPLGAALVERLDCFVSVLLTPIFVAICGLKMDVFAIQKLKNVGVIQLVIITALFGKIIGAALPLLFCRMPLRDALSLGLIMNSQGIIELAMLSDWKGANIMNEECFAIMMLSVLVLTGVISPLVKALYDPSRRFIAYRRRTIRHHRRHEELRILSCIHSEDNVKAMTTLLDASNPTKENPIGLFVLHLVKLSGRASSLLIAHLPRDKTSQNPSKSERIFNAFRKFEQQYRGHLMVHCYEGISPNATMHNDVCSLALKQRVSFIIIPLHKQSLYGNNVEPSHSYRHLSRNVLDKAPCSVGILIDRENRRKSRSALQKSQVYRVAVLFFGGADDREALAYAGLMSGHPNVLVNLLHFSSSTEVVSGTARSKMLDAEILGEFKANAHRNDRVSYYEESVMDATGVLDVITSMDNAYNLVMVGRSHGESQLIIELKKLNKRVELGAIGETLAATDFKVAPSVLVVQQQTRVWGMRDPEESTHLRRTEL
ncbi:Na_H_Exchanger domain-containing protein, partial [Cephalotus follicularis]